MSKNKIEKEFSDCDYSIGNIDVYFYRCPIGNNVRFSSITYSYVVNGVRYVNNYDALFYKLPDSPNINDKYVVAYNRKDPQKSLLLGDYPIKKDDDYNTYLKKGIRIDF